MDRALLPVAALYFVMMLLALLCIGGVYLLGKAKFKESKAYRAALMGHVRNSLKAVSLFALIAVPLMSMGWVDAMTVSYLCIPFFPIVLLLWSHYFRLIKHYRLHG